MEEVIETAGLDTIRYWIGPNLHLIQYPLRRGELYNQVAVFKSERYRADSDDWGTEDELEAHFAKTHESVKRALTRVKRDRRWPLYDRLPDRQLDAPSHHAARRFRAPDAPTYCTGSVPGSGGCCVPGRRVRQAPGRCGKGVSSLSRGAYPSHRTRAALGPPLWRHHS